MQPYENDLKVELFFTCFAILLGIALCVTVIIAYKKKLLYKWLMIGTLCISIIALPVCIRKAILLNLDISNSSYVSYVGEFECGKYSSGIFSFRLRSRVSKTMPIRLSDEDNTLLTSHAKVLPEGSYYGKVIYSERTRLLLDVVVYRRES